MSRKREQRIVAGRPESHWRAELRRCHRSLARLGRELAGGGDPAVLGPLMEDLEWEVRALERLLSKRTLAQYALEPPSEEHPDEGSVKRWWEG